MFAVFDRDSWRRSNESLSAVLVPPCVVISVHMTAPGYGKGSIAKVFSREVFDRVIEEEFSENDQHKDSEKSNFNGSNGGEELQASLMAIPIQNSAMVSRPQIFGVIVSAIGSLSAKLVVAVLSPQRRTRKKKPLLTPIREFASEKSQGKRRVSDLKNRVGKLRSEIKAATAINEEAKQIKVSEFREWKVKRSKDASELNDNDVVSFNSALESAAESKLVENIAFGEEVSKPESAVNLSTKQTTKELGRDRIGRSARFLPFPLLLVTLITTVNALYGPSTSVLQLNPSNFKSKILNSNGLVLVEYFAPWYGQCEALTPMYEKVASVLKGVVAALDVDAHRSLVQEYGIKGFPTIEVLPGKQPVDYQGAREGKSMVDFAKAHIRDLFGLDPYVNRSGDVWHASIDGSLQFVGYGYRCKAATAEKTKHALLVPYAKILVDYIPPREGVNLVPRFLGQLCKEPALVWSNEIRPNIPMEKLIVYHLNVSNSTKDKSRKLPAQVAGIFFGITEKLQHFKDLGVDGEVAKVGLDMKILIACTCFLLEQKLVKAWLVDKYAEALRCQKLLVGGGCILIF